MASRVGALIGKWKSLSCVWFFATPWTVHGILQARILEWVAFPFSRGSSQPRDGTQSSSLQVGSLPAKPQGKPKNTGVDSLFLLQGIFPTQGLNPGLPHCRWILYQLSYEGSPLTQSSNKNINCLFIHVIAAANPLGNYPSVLLSLSCYVVPLLGEGHKNKQKYHKF